MGYSEWSDAAYRRVSGERAGAASKEIFRGTGSIDPLMDPRKITVREARDSEHHPASVPIVVAFDVTGSMGDIPTRFARDLLGALMRRLVEQAWIADPQLLFAAVGDAVSDRAPLQVGQFESGLEMDMWLTRLWLEGGGGDAPESYLLAHWFAAGHTATDAWEKRRKKGYLFTIGDAPDKPLTPAQIQRVFGRTTELDTGQAAVIGRAAERWELFHVHVARGKAPHAPTLKAWSGLVGDRVLVLDQTDAICELIGVTMGLKEGRLTDDEARGLLVAAGMAEEAAVAAITGVRSPNPGD
ncbi:MAG: VWA domain-containing protein [Myxococcales bacterium]|nr:VWA domain-containing protein [Myxococcales bacterium]